MLTYEEFLERQPKVWPTPDPRDAYQVYRTEYAARRRQELREEELLWELHSEINQMLLEEEAEEDQVRHPEFHGETGQSDPHDVPCGSDDDEDEWDEF